MKLPQRLSQLTPALIRHLVASNSQAYEQILRYIRAQDDIWIVSQGEYIEWWQRREDASLKLTVSEGQYRINLSLDQAVIEKYPGEFLTTSSIPCPDTTLSGEVQITVDSTLEKKEILIEILKREGILNFRVADEGEFMLSRQDLGDLLKEIESTMSQRQGRLLEDDITAVRQIVQDKLAARHLPLLRVWYHPRLNGVVMRAVFSVRYDIDRAITNIASIRVLEQKYDVSSTLYLRAFCPFYTDRAVKLLAAQAWCPEIALHGEFVTHAGKYGDELKAAAAEKMHLEKLSGRPIRGVAMHGGELTDNRSEYTEDAIQEANLLYDTTPRPRRYFFPFRKLVNGRLSNAYSLSHALSDVNISVNGDYGQVFHEQAIAKMKEIYAQNGIFVLLLHPEYFGFFEYLAHPRNWAPLIGFFWRYFAPSRSARLTQEPS